MSAEQRALDLGITFPKQELGYLNLCAKSGNLLFTSGHVSDQKGKLGGGLSVQQGLEIIRSLRGLDLVGADLVEISPPYDPQGTTALVGANLAYEMLCVLPGVQYRA